MRTWTAGGVAEEGQATKVAIVTLRHTARQLMRFVTPMNIDRSIIHRDRRDEEGFTRLSLDRCRILLVTENSEVQLEGLGVAYLPQRTT